MEMGGRGGCEELREMDRKGSIHTDIVNTTHTFAIFFFEASARCLM